MPAQTVIKLRKDSAANWASVNPILANGEVGVDVDVYKFKVGNGSSTWTALPFASDPESVVAGLEAYADGAADAAEAAAISSANSYSDGLAVNYDAAGTAASAVTTHNDDTTSVHGIADTTVLLTTAGGTLTGYLTLHADPTQAFHAATKEYVDNVATGIITKPAVKAATTANLTANYSNGTLGVGATLTANANGAFPLIDGATVTTVNGDRGVLVKNQTTAAHNGRYNLTTQGDAGTPWVLTRCGLCDTDDEIPGMYVFVQDGTVNKGAGYVAFVADPDTFTIGTDAINYIQFSGAGTFVAGNGLVLTGNSFSIDGAIVATQADLASKQNVVAGVSDTEIGYLDGVTSAIQTQLNGKAATSHTHNITDITQDVVTLSVASGVPVALPSGLENKLVIVKSPGANSIQYVLLDLASYTGTPGKFITFALPVPGDPDRPSHCEIYNSTTFNASPSGTRIFFAEQGEDGSRNVLSWLDNAAAATLTFTAADTAYFLGNLRTASEAGLV